MLEMTKNTPLRGPKTAQKYAEIFKIRLDSTSYERVLNFGRVRLVDFSKKDIGSRKFFITTPNPEMLLTSLNDPVFAMILNRSDISLPDGIGLIQGIKFFSYRNPTNRFIRFFVLLFQGLYICYLTFFDHKSLTSDFKIIKGREMFIRLVALANKYGWRVFLLGGENDEAQRCKEVLKRSYKKVIIESFQGPIIDDIEGIPVLGKDKILNNEAIKRVNTFRPHLLFIAFGAPSQEKWLYRNFDRLDFGGAMVLGGAFNYISGRAKLPPRWMVTSFEWLWRLITQPKRLKRVFNASVVFPFKVFLQKLSSS